MSRKSVIRRLVTWLFAAHKRWVRSRQTDRQTHRHLTLWRSILRRSVDLENNKQQLMFVKLNQYRPCLNECRFWSRNFILINEIHIALVSVSFTTQLEAESQSGDSMAISCGLVFLVRLQRCLVSVLVSFTNIVLAIQCCARQTYLTSRYIYFN